MEYIQVTRENIEKEHICCAISNNKDVQVSSKKAWLTNRFDDGLVFLKSTERGKCFIEYIPAENAWNPIDADGYMYIDCLWVSGSFKGHGYSNDLLSACISDSKEKGKKGLCILCASRKKPFLADPKFLKYKGFTVCDEADNGIQLWYLPFHRMLNRRNSKNVPGIPIQMKKATFCTIQASARSMQNMSRLLSKLRKRMAYRSGLFILTKKKMRGQRRHPSQLTRCSMTENT